MKQLTKRFLLIDDDEINNFISVMTLKKSLGQVHIDEFTCPEKVLEFIKSAPNHSSTEEDGKTTLFLDINMPTMTGWEFIEAFDHLAAYIKEQYNIYILSSSKDITDINRAKKNPLVIGYIEKPLNIEVLHKLFGR